MFVVAIGIMIVDLLLIAAIFWLRMRRLIRYYQLEGYDSKRYLSWFFHQKNEWLYLAGCIGALILGWVIFVGTIVHSDFDDGGFLVWRWVGFTIIALLLLTQRPQDKQAKQGFNATSRAVRLIITAILASILVGFLLNTILFTVFYGDFRHTLLGTIKDLGNNFLHIFLIYFAQSPELIAVGLFAIVLAPFSLPLANLINWPIEESFRRYYLSLAARRVQNSGATVIALTGSYGKTSTKHYLQHILSGRYRVLMTPKSYNTLLGVSRVINEILADDASYDYFIVEAGAYIPGEIARICRLVKPRIGIVVTVGPMHLERFGSMENIVTAKYEIIQALPPDGVGVFNADDPNVLGMAQRGYPDKRVLVSQKGAADAQIAASNVIMKADGLHFDLRDNQTGDEIKEVYAPLYGEHNVTNILLAVGVARNLGMSLPEIKLRIASLEPAEHRLVRRVMPDGTIIIDDAYSANPVGTQMALSVLALQSQERPDARRVVVSSGMFELGPISDEENRKLGERIAAVATDVILIGKQITKPVQEGLAGAHFPPDHLHVVDSLDEAISIYKNFLHSGDALLMLTDLPDVYA